VTAARQPLRVGGPVASGKTALMEQLCKRLKERQSVAAVTNDFCTKEDARILVEAGALPPERILGVETGGCPHTAIREDVDQPRRGRRDAQALPRPRPDPHRIGRRQSCRHLLARARGSRDLRHRRLERRKNPAERGPGRTRSDLLVINKTDLAPYVGASLEVMARDAAAQRTAARPYSPT